MTKKIARRETQDLAPLIADDLAYAAKLAASDTADATREAYENDFRYWSEYAEAHGLEAFPVGPGGLAAYIGYLAKEGYTVSTIRRRCAAIAYYHRSQKAEDGEFYVSPTEHHTIRRLLRGLVREHGKAPEKKTALTVDMVRKMVTNIDNRLADGIGTQEEFMLCRDRTVLLVGFVTGMRRSELEYLEWDHIDYLPEGAIVTIPLSKTDQQREGQYVAIPELEDGDSTFCAVQALRDWEKYLDQRGHDSAYVFDCSGKTINRIVQRHVKGVVGDSWVDYGAHSFRSGFATEAHRAGGNLEDIMAQTRHKSRDVAQSYIQHVDLAQNPATLRLVERLQGVKTT